MTRDDFWRLLEGLDPETAEEQLRERLEALELAEVASFADHFDREFDRAYDWKLWAAAYIMDGGCSDDGFMDFRFGLISRGRKVFEAVLADPDSLAEMPDKSSFIPNEAFGYVAREVYEAKSGTEMPRVEFARRSEPAGEEWDHDDDEQCAKRLPKLWKKYGNKS